MNGGSPRVDAADTSRAQQQLAYRPPGALRYQSPIRDGATGLLEETIIPGTSSVELYRTPTTDYLSRFLSISPHIAELYHCNSRIVPSSDVNTVLDPEALKVARDWFYDTALKPDDEVYDRDAAREAGILGSIASLAERAGAALAWLAEAGARDIGYALDVLVLDLGRTWRVLPGSPEAWLERVLSADEVKGIPALLPELRFDPEAALPVLVFITVSPWRYMMLQGPRGYRRALLDAGRFVGTLMQEAGRTGSAIDVSVDFFDVEIDRLLRLDGVERSCVAALAFAGDNAQEAPHD